MALEGYKEVREGVYQSDEFFTKRPKIDDERIRQILEKQRNYTPPASVNRAEETVCTVDPSKIAQENEHSGA